MLPLADQIERVLEIEGVGSERMRGDLAMEYLGGDIGIIGRNLAPSDSPCLGGYADKPDKFIRKCRIYSNLLRKYKNLLKSTNTL